MASYFVNIVGSDKKRMNSKLNINLHDVYETFVENKLKKILFQDKNNMELSNTITRGMLERELLDRTRVYKKLAADALFQDSIFMALSFKEFENMTPLDNEELYNELYRIKTGADKTGLISHVTADSVAMFIHRSFAEYFAAEYACDILKSRKYGNSAKVLWYCALTLITGVRDWIDAKRKIDKTLENILKEIEKPSPLYTIEYSKLLAFNGLSQAQCIRILASSEEDYENISFTAISDVFTKSFWERLDHATRRNIIEYLQSYKINQMKIHLKAHFSDRFLFILENNSFHRSYTLDSHFNERLNFNRLHIHDICLKIEIVGQKGNVPVWVRLEHKDGDDSINFGDSDLETNNKIDTRANNTCTSHMYILCDTYEFTMGSYSTPESVRAFDTLMATTGTVRCRLQHSEQNVQVFADSMPKIFYRF